MARNPKHIPQRCKAVKLQRMKGSIDKSEQWLIVMVTSQWRERESERKRESSGHLSAHQRGSQISCLAVFAPAQKTSTSNFKDSRERGIDICIHTHIMLSFFKKELSLILYHQILLCAF